MAGPGLVDYSDSDSSSCPFPTGGEEREAAMAKRATKKHVRGHGSRRAGGRPAASPGIFSPPGGSRADGAFGFSPGSDASSGSFFGGASVPIPGGGGFSFGVGFGGTPPDLHEQFAKFGLRDDGTPGERPSVDPGAGQSPAGPMQRPPWSTGGADGLGAGENPQGDIATPGSSSHSGRFKPYREDGGNSSGRGGSSGGTEGFPFGQRPNPATPPAAAAAPSGASPVFVFGSAGGSTEDIPSTPSTSGLFSGASASVTPPSFPRGPFDTPPVAGFRFGTPTPPPAAPVFGAAYSSPTPTPFSSGLFPPTPSPAAPGLRFNLGASSASPGLRKGRSGRKGTRPPQRSPAPASQPAASQPYQAAAAHPSPPNPSPPPAPTPPPFGSSGGDPLPVFSMGVGGGGGAGGKKTKTPKSSKSAPRGSRAARGQAASEPTPQPAWEAAGEGGGAKGDGAGVLRESTWAARNNQAFNRAGGGRRGREEDFDAPETSAAGASEGVGSVPTSAQSTPGRPVRRAVRPGQRQSPARGGGGGGGNGAADILDAFGACTDKYNTADDLGDYTFGGPVADAGGGGGGQDWCFTPGGSGGGNSGGGSTRSRGGAAAAAAPRPVVVEPAADVAAAESSRERGNEAFARRRYRTAEECYSQAIEAAEAAVEFASPSAGGGGAEAASRVLATSLSNRAAARLMLGRPAEALGDCRAALTTDPSFTKARMRAGTCLLRLGRFAHAAQHFAEVLSHGHSARTDGRADSVRSEARASLRQAEAARHDVEEAVALLAGGGEVGGGRKRRDDGGGPAAAAAAALHKLDRLVADLAPSGDTLLYRLRAMALAEMGKHAEVVEALEQQAPKEGGGGARGEEEEDLLPPPEELLEAVGAQVPPEGAGVGGSGGGLWAAALSPHWRARLLARACYQLGDVAAAVALLEPMAPRWGGAEGPQDTGLAEEQRMLERGREVLSLKEAGNRLFKAGKGEEAVAQYTKVLEGNSGSARFDAICFCNRAAAYQVSSQHLDAIADCTRAHALDPTYQKALSRRATLRMELRDPAGATSDLERLLQLLPRVSDSAGSPASSAGGLARADVASRLRDARTAAARKVPMDLYKVMGLPHSCSSADVKKAYRQLALRHHPDKACGAAISGAPPAVQTAVREEAEASFKAVGEAYGILSDREKRLTYDGEEATREVARRAEERARGGGGGAFYSRSGRRGAGASEGSTWGRSGAGSGASGGWAYRQRGKPTAAGGGGAGRAAPSYDGYGHSYARAYARTNWREQGGTHDTFNGGGGSSYADYSYSSDEDYY